MLTLYAAPADPIADAIARTLELLAVPYVHRDPAADPSAADRRRPPSREGTGSALPHTASRGSCTYF